MVVVADVLPWFREASRRLRAAGLMAESERLDSVVQCAYTTSSELLGEIGLAVVEVRRRLGEDLPTGTASLLGLCLAEVRKVWPLIGEDPSAVDRDGPQ